jgi:putative ABC transport system permease protein
MAIPLSYNVRSMFQRPVSTFTTAVGIALTVAIFVGALALANGFRSALATSGSNDNVLVLRKGADAEISSEVSREAAAILKAHPAVAQQADGRAYASAECVVVSNEDRVGQKGSSNLTVRGVDAGAATLHGDFELVAGRMFTPGSDEVIVGRRIAPRFANCQIGDRIRFQQREFTVVGHFAAGGTAFESEIWGDADPLMAAFDRGNSYQTVLLRLRDPSQYESVKTEWEADPRLQVQVFRERDYFANQSEMLTTLIRFIGVFITVIMAVGALFGAMNTMYAAVASRRREIGTLLVLGFHPLAIMSSFVFESVCVALLGGALGCVLALPMNGIGTSTTNFASFSEVAFAFRVTPVGMLAGLVFAAIIGAVGGFLPAVRAARQSPTSSLRGE